MRKIAASALIALSAGCLGPASAAPGKPRAELPEACAAMPVVRAVTLSANGRVLAWIQSGGSQREAVAYHPAAHRVQRVFQIDPRMKPWALSWDGSDMLLLTVTMAVHPQAPGVNIHQRIARILALDLKTGQARELLMSGNGMLYVTAARLLLADPHRQHGVILFTYEWSANAYRPRTGTWSRSSRDDSGWPGNLCAVDPHGGDDRVIGHDNAFTIGWVVRRRVANGYAALRPPLTSMGVNGPGGATGILGQWDARSQNYAIAGVRTLIRPGMDDAHRVCVVGVSYGGYAARAAAAFSPQTYACAVSINGRSDPPAFVRQEISVAGRGSTGTARAAYGRGRLGSPSDPELIAQSPERTDALIRLGKSVTLIPQPGRDLRLDRASTRSALLRAIRPLWRRYRHEAWNGS